MLNKVNDEDELEISVLEILRSYNTWSLLHTLLNEGWTDRII